MANADFSRQPNTTGGFDASSYRAAKPAEEELRLTPFQQKLADLEKALPAALELAAKYQVEMPIVQTVNAVVNKGMSAAEAVRSLMDRDPKNELPQSYEK